MTETAQTDHMDGADAKVASGKRAWTLWRVTKIAAICLTVLAVIILILGLLLDTAPGRRFLAQQISALEFENGLDIDVGAIDGSIYGEAIIRDVRLSDPQKTFLTLEEARLDWRPLSWLQNLLDIRALTLRNGTLLALPELLETDNTAPILPDFDIRLDSLTSENFTIHPDIAGEERILALTAKADIRGGRVLMDINAAIQAGEDRLMAKVDISPDADIFDLDLDVNAPVDGVLARMAGLRRGLEITAQGDGSYSNWQGVLQAKDEQQLLADLALKAQAGTYAVQGDVFPASFVDGELAALIGETVSIDGEAVMTDRVLDGRLRTNLAALSLEGQGAVDLANNLFDDLAVTATARQGDLDIFGVSTKALVAKMLFNGSFDDWRSPLDISMNSVAFDDFRAEKLIAKADIASNKGRISGELDMSAARLITGIKEADALLGPPRISGDFAFEDNILTSKAMTIDAGKLRGQLGLVGRVQANDYRVDGQISLNDYIIENVATADIAADIQLAFGKALSAQAAINGKTRNVVNQTVAQYVGENIGFSGQIDYADQQPVIFRNVEIASAKLALLGGGRLEADGNAVIRAAGRHSDYGAFDVNAEGQGSLAQATIVLDSPLPALGLSNVELAGAAAEQGFAITAKGGSLAGPFDALTNIMALADGRTQIAVRELNISNSLITGDIFTGDSGTNGEFLLSGGGVNGNIRLSSQQETIIVTSDIKLANARFAGDTPTLIRQGAINIKALFGNDLPKIDAAITAQGISRGNLFIGRIAAKADLPGCLSSGNISDRACVGNVTASLAGRRGSRFSLQTRSRIERDRIAVDVDGAYGLRAIGTSRSAIINKTANGWRLAKTRLTVGRGSMGVSGLFGMDRQSVNLDMQALPLAVLDVGFSELGLSGTASGQLNLNFRNGQNPRGEAKLRLNRLARSTIALTSRPVDLAMNAQLNDDNLAVRTIIRDKNQELGRAQMRLANIPANTDFAEGLARADLLGEIKYSGPVDALWRLTGIDVLDMTGNVDVRAQASGTLDNPLVQGKLATQNARVESVLSGTIIEKIAVNGRFAGDKFTLTSLKGKTPNGGDVLGSGTLRFGGKQFATLDLAFDVRNANLLVRDDFAATVTGRITAKSEGDRSGVLGGDVIINQGRFNLGKAEVITELPDIAYREINRRPDEAPPFIPPTPWRFAIKARANNRIAVRGLGIDSEWRADIAINGPTITPRISGTANLIRGEYEFAGRDFDLERGLIRFQETFPADPLLDIVATANLSGIDADIRVGGTGLRPEITFTSIPQLPEDELLARLLFGSSVTDISAPEAVQLAAALTSLRSGGGLDPINALRGAIGLDRLRIIAADPSIGQGISIGAGKYITRNIYVEVITDGQGYSATQAEFQITRWLSILSTVSTIGRQSVNARISRDY